MDNTFINRRWLVIPSTIVELIDFNQILETSVESLRFSIDGSKTFIKYEENQPGYIDWDFLANQISSLRGD